jgi:hypothetical protein
MRTFGSDKPKRIRERPHATIIGPERYDGIVAFSQTDFTSDLKKISVPTLVMCRRVRAQLWVCVAPN